MPESIALRTRLPRGYLRRLQWLLVLIVALVGTGTVGYAVAESTGPWNAFLWTIDTITTLGTHPPPRDVAGQAVQVVLLVTGVGTLFYALASATEFFVAGHLSGLLEERRQQRMIDALTDHYLICGFGRVGRQVARSLRGAGCKYVVIDPNAENREHVQGIGVRFIEGSASDDEVLEAAGIMRAAGIVACVDSDAENIFITLTARELRSDITIVARAAADDSETKLRRAGADRVISPYKTSGHEMARQVLHPQVFEVLDVDPEYRLEEIEVTEGCAGVGQALEDIRGTATIVALRRRDGGFLAQPPTHTRLAAGDRIIVLGLQPIMDRLEALFDATAARLQ
ncbi:MAG: potassium channel family protein [Solirubrobacteraceae bacterium]|nr:MAG: hypothetical protein DLM63_07400 [Solirubrobacterales bacterium]